MQLKDHVHRHPDWIGLKNKEWHLDHIFPIQAFLDYGIKDVKIINNLENLRPTYWKDNLDKSDDYCIEDFEYWLRLKGVVWKK